MKQEVKIIENSGPKLIKRSLDSIIKDGYTIVQIMLLNKTTYLVLCAK